MSGRSRGIVIATASLSGRDAFAKHLAARGLSVWPIPVTRASIRRAAVERLAQVVDDGNRFDWLIVTSRRVSSVVKQASAIVNQAPMRVAAVGPATAASLEARGVHVDFVGTGTGGRDLARLILSASPKRPLRHLWPRASGADRSLSRTLCLGGGTVREIAVYDTTPRPLRHRARIERAFVMDQIGAVSFFAPSAVRAFVRQLSELSLAALSTTVVASLGRSTSAELRSHGLEPRVQFSKGDVGAFANEIASAIEADGQRRPR